LSREDLSFLSRPWKLTDNHVRSSAAHFVLTVRDPLVGDTRTYFWLSRWSYRQDRGLWRGRDPISLAHGGRDDPRVYLFPASRNFNAFQWRCSWFGESSRSPGRIINDIFLSNEKCGMFFLCGHRVASCGKHFFCHWLQNLFRKRLADGDLQKRQGTWTEQKDHYRWASQSRISDGIIFYRLPSNVRTK